MKVVRSLLLGEDRVVVTWGVSKKYEEDVALFEGPNYRFTVLSFISAV